MTQEQVIAVINSVIKKYPNISKRIGQILPNDIEPINPIVGYTEKGVIKDYVFSLFPDRINDTKPFYHYLKFDYAKQILENKEIQLSALSHYIASDSLEYTGFFKEFITYYPTINIENDKNDIFILCMTEDCENDYMWQHYADEKKGVVLGFRLFKKDNACYHIRNVIYEDTESLTFLKDINSILQNDKLLFYPEGISTIPLFYKQKKFEIEKEIRLCLDFTGVYKYIEPYPILSQSIQEEDNRRYLPLSLDNKLFKIELCEVICGEDVTQEQIELLKKLIPDNVSIRKQ